MKPLRLKEDEAPPGVLRKADAIDWSTPDGAAQAKKAKRVPVTCIGCGLELGDVHPAHPDTTKKFTVLKLPETTPYYAYLCGTGAYHLDPKVSCRRSAFEKLRICPGCGAQGNTLPGTICSSCEKTLAAGREVERAAESGKRAWYAIDVRELFGFVKNGKEAAVALAKAVTPPGYGWAKNVYEARKLGMPHWPKASIPPFFKGDSAFQSANERITHDPHLELTPTQAEAFRELAKILQEAWTQCRKESRREGRSLLMSLASGDLSTKDLNDRIVRQNEGDEKS